MLNPSGLRRQEDYTAYYKPFDGNMIDLHVMPWFTTHPVDEA